MNKNKKQRVIGDELLDNGLPKLLDKINMRELVKQLIPFTEKLFPMEKLNLDMSMWKIHVSEQDAYNKHIEWIVLTELFSSVVIEFVKHSSTKRPPGYIGKSLTKRLEKRFLHILHHHIKLRNEFVDYNTKGIKSDRLKKFLEEEKIKK